MDCWLEKYIRAGSPDTSAEELEALSADDIDNVRRRVAENHNTTASVLAVLASDPHCDVRMAVGENRNTPYAILESLCHDDSIDVRYALAENHHLPEAILETLADDENPYVSSRAIRTLRALNPASVKALKPRDQGRRGEIRSM